MIRHFIIILLALVFVLLAVVEHVSYRDWDNSQARHLEIQSRMVAAQFRNFRTDQLLRRMAHDTLLDPGMKDGLKRFGILFQTSGSKSTDEHTNQSAAPTQALPDTSESHSKKPLTPPNTK